MLARVVGVAMVLCLLIYVKKGGTQPSKFCMLMAPFTPCSAKNPSNDTCGDLCGKGTVCSDNGACMCSKEPSASKIGGAFTHCTNFDYVEQKSSNQTCTAAGKSDHRVCWTCSPGFGNYCTCFDKKKPPHSN